MPICSAAYVGEDLPHKWIDLVKVPYLGIKTSSAYLFFYMRSWSPHAQPSNLQKLNK